MAGRVTGVVTSRFDNGAHPLSRAVLPATVTQRVAGGKEKFAVAVAGAGRTIAGVIDHRDVSRLRRGRHPEGFA